MITIITIFSIILHCISIFAIIILYVRQNQYKETERKMEKLRSDIDDIFQTYMVEMKEENKEMAALLLELQQREEKPSLKPESMPSLKMKQPMQMHDPEQDLTIKPSKRVAVSAYKSVKKLENKKAEYEPPYESIKDEVQMSVKTEAHKEEVSEGAAFQKALNEQLNKFKQDQPVKSDEEKAIEMRNEGLEIEQIAKALNKGKTEIELLLKFHANSKG